MCPTETVDTPADYGEGLAPGARAPGPYAASAVSSRGRLHPEPDCPTRSPFQRDRDRVLHSSAFRRLTHKTQVFIFHEGDHYRSRLTHSLEVAQIARTVARQLRLDEDLAEAIALAHDLGHPPFGHAGERALDRAMHAFGGFDHNAQSLRVVTRLERKYAGFDGLNLTFETLDGLIKHNGPVQPEAGQTQTAASAASVMAKIVARWPEHLRPDLARWPSAEAQVAALADDIAYVSHDIDDGLRAGLIARVDLADVPLAGPPAGRAAEAGLDEARAVFAITRAMITDMIADCVAESRRRLATLAPASPADICAADHAMVAFSPCLADDVAGLKAFLFQRVYRAPRVMTVMGGAESVVEDLFVCYMADASALPAGWRDAAARLVERKRARTVGDFVAGMTDRYALAEHRRLFDRTPELR
jgi:dGTPase